MKRTSHISQLEVLTPIIYGAGIPVNPDRPINICKEFSLTALDDVLNQLEDKIDRIAYPYIYAGAWHSLFPWHIEDEGLYSINYLFKGAKKLWHVSQCGEYCHYQTRATCFASLLLVMLYDSNASTGLELPQNILGRWTK